MYDNVLAETLYIEKLYGEYISHVNRYQNLQRMSIFARYLNINKAASTFNHDVNATFDRYNSGIQYDIYDYTPLFMSSQVINDAADTPDLKGQQFAGPLTITVYTIKEPRIEDLLIFNRPPQEGLEVFRVDHVRAALNAMQSAPNANWFELTLEYAPIENLDKLNYLNHYIYSLPLQKYLFAKDFEREVKQTQKLVDIFMAFEKINFNDKCDLYYYTTPDGQKIAPLFENSLIYNLLAMKGPYEDHFYNFNRPYGVNRFGSELALDIETGVIIDFIPEGTFNFYDTIEDAVKPLNVYEVAHLIGLWIWERDRERYKQIRIPERAVLPNIACMCDDGRIRGTAYDPELGIQGDVDELGFNVSGIGADEDERAIRRAKFEPKLGITGKTEDLPINTFKRE